MHRTLSCLMIFMVLWASLLTPASHVAAAAWEQTITPLGSGFESSYPGGWVLVRTQNTVSCSINATNLIYTRTRAPGNTNAVDWARWRPSIPSTDYYQVFVHIPAYTHDLGITPRARYQVTAANGVTTVILNQNDSQCSWVSLGWFPFNAGTAGSVYLGDYTGDDPHLLIAADGVKFVVNQPPLVPTQVAPAEGATTTTAGITLQAQDAGDPDNGPRGNRDFLFRIETTDGSWSQESGWGGASWSFTLPSAAAYRWRVQAGDGVAGSGWSAWRGLTYSPQTVPTPTLTRSRLYVDSRNYLMLEFCGQNIHQDVYVGAKRDGRDFGIIAKVVSFGSNEQCATAENLADGGVLANTTYQTGIGLRSQDVYVTCNSAQGLCNSFKTALATPVLQPKPHGVPAGAWKVPFFWQEDLHWKDDPLGGLTGKCGKIGPCGCALTSTAMNLAYYGVATDPGQLGKSMGKAAGPLNWVKAVEFSQNKVTGGTRIPFTWSRLEVELKSHPVILELTRTCDGKSCNHFVVAISGNGSDPKGYLVNDPGIENGEATKLDLVLDRRKYQVTGIRLYIPEANAQPAGPKTRAPLSKVNTKPIMQRVLFPAGTEVITGSTQMYDNNETVMTMKMVAVSNAGPVTEMRLWTDTMQSDIWQPFATYAELPLSTQIYIQFRDQAGNISNVVTGTAGPEFSPPEEPSSWQVFLPTLAS